MNNDIMQNIFVIFFISPPRFFKKLLYLTGCRKYLINTDLFKLLYYLLKINFHQFKVVLNFNSNFIFIKD